jgi:cobalamin synthase
LNFIKIKTDVKQMDKKYTFSNLYLISLYISAVLIGVYIGSTYKIKSGAMSNIFFVAYLITMVISGYFQRKDKKEKIEKYGKEFATPSWRMQVILLSTMLMIFNVSFTLTHDYLSPNNHFNKITMPLNIVLLAIAITFFTWEKRKRKIS